MSYLGSRMAPPATILPFHVLMVDDDEAEIDITRFALQNARPPLQFSGVTGGEALLENLRQEGGQATHPNLILLDLNMPGLNGFDVLRELKSDPDLSGIPVIVFTTSDDQRDIIECYQLQANAFVTKPADLDDYEELILQIDRFRDQAEPTSLRGA